MISNLIDTQNKTIKPSEKLIIDEEKTSIQDLKTAKDSRSPSSEDIDYTKNIIIKKTLRGRKEKMSLPKNKLKCEICLEFYDYSKEDLISCSTCKCFFHKSCYNQFVLFDNSSYKCIRCVCALQLNQNISDLKCFICFNSNGVLNRNNETRQFYHQVCLNFLIEFQGKEGEDICKEMIRKWRYKNSCRYCGEKLSKMKAVIKCKNPKCKEFYHIPCAIQKGMIFDLNYMRKFYEISENDTIPFYCANHNKKISFLYKTHVNNDTFDISCQRNIDKNDLNLLENKFSGFGDLEDNEDKLDKNENEEETKRFKFICRNGQTFAILEDEEEDLSNKNEYPTAQNDQRDSQVSMDIDNSFESNENKAFKLDFEKFLDKNDFNENICNHNDNIFNTSYPYYCHNNNFILSRQNSYNTLPFNNA